MISKIIDVLVMGKTQHFESGMDRSKKKLHEFQNAARTQGGMAQKYMGGMFASISGAAMRFLGPAAIAASIGMLGKSMVQLSMEAEQTQIAFEVLLGSSGKAKTLVNQLKELSAKTPMSSADVANAAKTLLQFGVAGKDVTETLRRIGDAAGGNSERFASMALAYGQMWSTGKLQGQDLLQMINAGFNPLKELSRTTGKSVATLKEEMSKGAISAQMVADAFKTATGEGGQFFQMMEKQSGSMGGMLSTLQDNVALVMTDIGDIIIEAFDLKGGTKQLLSWTDNLRTFVNYWKPAVISLGKSMMTVVKAVYSFTSPLAMMEKLFTKHFGSIEKVVDSFRDNLLGALFTAEYMLNNFGKVLEKDFLQKMAMDVANRMLELKKQDGEALDGADPDAADAAAKGGKSRKADAPGALYRGSVEEFSAVYSIKREKELSELIKLNKQIQKAADDLARIERNTREPVEVV